MSMQVRSKVFVGFISRELTVVKMDNDIGLKASKKSIYSLEYSMFNSSHSLLVQVFRSDLFDNWMWNCSLFSQFWLVLFVCVALV
jgi:hypothetical protein